MINEAEAHKDKDAARKAMIEAKNEADGVSRSHDQLAIRILTSTPSSQLIYSTEKTVAENKDKVPSSTVQEVETAIAELKQALEKDDVEAIKSKTQALSQATMKIGQAIYGKQGGDAGSSGASEEGQKKDENVYDAEYQEKKDDDKKQ